MEMVWIVEILPDRIKANATTAIRIPQNIFLLFCGFRFPSEVSMDSTKVAESAEVMKKIISKTMAINDKTIPNGY